MLLLTFHGLCGFFCNVWVCNFDMLSWSGLHFTHCPFICSCVHSYTLSIYLFLCAFLHTVHLFPCAFLHTVHLFPCAFLHTVRLFLCAFLPSKSDTTCLGLRIVSEKRTEKEDREPVLVTVTWYLTFPQRTCAGHSDLVFNIPTENLCWSQWLGI